MTMGFFPAALALAFACVLGDDAIANNLPKLGHSMKDHFALAEGYTNLNHGSYGSPPKIVLQAANEWRMRVESNPDLWFRFDMYNELDKVRAQVAKYVGANKDDVAFVDNASHGINAVLRSLKIPQGKKILYLSSAYAMVKNTLRYLEDFDDDQLLEVPIEWPSTQDAIVDAVSNAFEANEGRIYVACFSHIVSVPGTILPVEDLVRLTHKHSSMALIDGAHALGQVPLNLTNLNADFWVGNGHKWLYSPKGSAILWVRRDRQTLVEPTTISWEGKGISHFQVAFSYQGTGDVSPYLSISAALDFREWLGGEERIMNYTHSLCMNGGNLLAKKLGTKMLFSSSDRYAQMVDVHLPSSVTRAMNISEKLIQKYNTYVPVYSLASDADAPCFARVSCQIYNDLGDFEMLANAILEIIAPR